MINWSLEIPQIEKVAAEYAVDPFFIAAIRHAENGAAGREFGVLSEDATTYEAQLRGACASLRGELSRYVGNAFDVLQGPKVKRLIYRKAFITWFASIWAPGGARNDPTNLNANWARNATVAYLTWVTMGHVQ